MASVGVVVALAPVSGMARTIPATPPGSRIPAERRRDGIHGTADCRGLALTNARQTLPPRRCATAAAAAQALPNAVMPPPPSPTSRLTFGEPHDPGIVVVDRALDGDRGDDWNLEYSGAASFPSLSRVAGLLPCVVPVDAAYSVARVVVLAPPETV